ncbi:MAG: Maf-like protein [Prevotella bivia]|uniref:dTTP/UTP pyrophosphatase n=2 Tax=Prevotella bivia TaxID=28125 RepID=A0A096BQQ4_9BACT|nr:Maf-like protein [Prevotella bivia]KGF38472.1 septum formation inhibitor Maf [Prevotella bivia DNF00650]KGF45007.1 septum formation inhibitor Maf [Prevotella bivia DNF00320]KXO18058.1 septum formation protein Maf [Prevotella bivia]MDU3909110.1 Maf-like protein [Prevotella bivia]MDU6554538.1 Maf-like protein [Prevotella bivia]
MNIVLASNSPRRRELLAGLGIEFEVRVLPDIDESYPADLPVMQIAEYIAHEKASAYLLTMKDNDLVITADTVVIIGNEVLGKPKDEEDAKRMLRLISGKTHQVVTGVCLTTTKQQRHFSVSTDVTFKNLPENEINYYITKYKPFDKAGAYGIQEWIGYVGVTSLNGSYFNVMGLPVQKLWEELKKYFIHDDMVHL